MELQTDFDTLLKIIARDRLKLYGIVQHDDSRSFHCDKDWLTFIVEFQSSTFSPGTYLNVGVDFHFYPREHFAFSYVNRVSDFIEFTDEKQFVKVIDELCDLAIKRFQLLERNFKDIWTAIDTLEEDKTHSYFDLAVLYALTENFDKAIYELKHLSDAPCEYDWHFERQEVINKLIGRIEEDPSTFLEKFKIQINQTRQLKKLKPAKLNKLTERKKKADSAKFKGSKRWLLKLFGFE
jgi:hypothetical protein